MGGYGMQQQQGGYGMQQQQQQQQLMAQQAAMIQQQQLVLQQQQQQWGMQAMPQAQPQMDMYGQYGSTAGLPGDPALQMMGGQQQAALANPYAQMGQQPQQAGMNGMGGMAGMGMGMGQGLTLSLSLCQSLARVSACTLSALPVLACSCASSVALPASSPATMH